METAVLETELEPAKLSLADIDAIYDLHRETFAALPNPGAVRPDEPAFFHDIFDCGGEITGLYGREGLVGYGVLRPELAAEKDRVALEAWLAPHRSLWVLDGSAVKPTYWGRGLQRHLVGLRTARAGALGVEAVIAKASPGNVPSMRNLLKSGFSIVGRIQKSYGWRYIHYRPVAEAMTHPEAGEWIEASAIAEAQRRFEAGEVATQCALNEAGVPALHFAAVAPDAR